MQKRTIVIGLFLLLVTFAFASGSGKLDRAALVALMEQYLEALAKHGIKNGWE